jgi:hypothetical protein
MRPRKTEAAELPRGGRCCEEGTKGDFGKCMGVVPPMTSVVVPRGSDRGWEG